jgi:RND superfamily putative drug exporter
MVHGIGVYAIVMRSGRHLGRASAATWFASIGQAVVRARAAIVVAWIIAAVLAATFLPSIFASEGGSLGNLLPSSSKAVVAEERALQDFGVPFVSPTLVVAHSERPLTVRQMNAAGDYVGEVEEGRGGMPLRVLPLLQLPELLSSAAARTTLLGYLYIEPGIGEGRRKAAADRFAGGLGRATGLANVQVTGPVPAGWAQQRIGDQRLLWLELATVAIVIGILAFYFRAAFVPLLGLATVAVAYLMAAHLLGWAGAHLGVTVPSEVDPVIVALLFGILTDYVVFFVSGWRRRLAAGVESREAVAQVTAELLPVVLTAALMITGSILTLLLSGVHFLVAFVPGMAVAVLTGATVSVTFVPAVMAWAGPRLLWPRGVRTDRSGDIRGGARARIVGFAAARPAIVLIPTVLALGALGLGVTGMSLGDPVVRGLPTSTAPRRGYDLVSETFGPGVVGPTMLMIERDGLADSRERLEDLQGWLARQAGVAAVLGPADDPLAAAHGVVLAPGGDAARFALVFSGDPSGAAAADSLSRLKGRLPAELQRLGLRGAETFVGGDTAITLELNERVADALVRVLPIALLVPLLLLWALLRSKIAALYLVGVTGFTIAASLGLTTLYFQSVLGHGELAFFVPIAAAILLLALGCDYNVFFVSRIWREAERTNLREAITTAGSRAGRTVTVAGMTLVLSFAAVALIPILAFRELAFALCAGLLVDTLVARTLLVPALISLLGGGPRSRRRERG